ncbi:hypothetical protein [uncultured Veillonella sp.]|uniref:hypothetical protein n=1 Tax=uncultured Veillonella sp. TaxID=159268 RepID=UPI0025FE366D|nr:hypothetical protein [uncultured Veillonella sp.]MDY3974281.1 hypothetical protein [Veillonella caviae]
MTEIKNSQLRKFSLQPYEALGIRGENVINEIIRCIAMKHILEEAHPAYKEAPDTVDVQDLFDAAKATEADFGPLPFNEVLVDREAVKQVYIMSIPNEKDSGSLPRIVSETGYSEGLAGGALLREPLERIVETLATSEGMILFAYVEEYLDLLPFIMKQIPMERLLLYVVSEATAHMIKALYPLAPVITDWPEDVVFDHIVAATTGLFRAPVAIMEELALRVGNITPEGTAHFLIPISAVQDQMGVNRMAIQFMLLQKRLEVVREWAPLGVYEFAYTNHDIKKVRLEIAELVADGIASQGVTPGSMVRTTPFIALPHEVLASMDTFSLVAYGLSLCGIAPALQAQLPTLGEDGYMTVDSKLPAYRQKLMYAAGGMKLLVKRKGTDVTISLEVVEPKRDFTASMTEEAYDAIVNESLPTMSEAESYWFFPDERAAFLWHAFFSSEKGKIILKTLAQMVISTPALLQLMGSIRRQIVKEEGLNELTTALKAAATAYEQELVAIKSKYEMQIDSLSEGIIPDTMRFDKK